MQKSQVLKILRILNENKKEDENKSFCKAKYLDNNKSNIRVTKDDKQLERIFIFGFSFNKLIFNYIF